MYKIERSDLLDLVAVIGIDPNSDGLARAKARGYEAPHNGIDWVSENPDAVGLVFDAKTEALQGAATPKAEGATP